MKKIAILGSTGSIGAQALEIVRKNPDLQVLGLAAGSNVGLLEKQIREFRPRLAAVWSDEALAELRLRAADMPVRLVCGMEGLLELAAMAQTDMLVTAIVGMIGLKPTIAAIEAGKDIALANKETLVTAGHLIMPLAKEKGVRLLPVDSEHSAIFQSLQGQLCQKTPQGRPLQEGGGSGIEKLLLTASGGPFRGKTREELKKIRVEDALKHPNWAMGKKITVDSSTLVNKGLEVIEARWLFGVDVDRIQVVVHPESIIHSMVQFTDGGIIAQLGMPDMKLPIQYALFYPERRPLEGRRVDFFTLGRLTFEKPDEVNFPGLRLAYEAGRAGGSLPAAYNAANEAAVGLFLQKKIHYLQITEYIEEAMRRHRRIACPGVGDILDTERESRELVRRLAEDRTTGR